MRNNSLRKIIASVTIIGSLLCGSYSHATVTMIGSRVIYPAGAKEKMLQFSNPDPMPYVVQVWTDINSPKSRPETADGPFITIPQLFRIEPKQGQVVRLMFNNQLSLPNDRESLFHFNFLQLPGMDSTQADKNKVVLLVTSRLKIFYRPQKLDIAPEQISEKIKFKLNDKKLEIFNDSPYYATFDEIELLDANQKAIASTKDVPMVAPLSQDSVSITPKGKAHAVSYTIINDFGVPTRYQFKF